MEDSQNVGEKQTAAALYRRLEVDREPYLERARTASRFTIGAAYPHKGSTGSTKFPTPYQSLGARGVNNLTAKLLLTLFPPNTPIFKYEISDYIIEELTQQEGKRAEIEELLSKRERAAQGEIETRAIRVSGFEGLRLLVIGGNVLFYLPTEGGMKVFSLEKYVVHRDPMGDVTDIVVKESISPASLSSEIKNALFGDELKNPKDRKKSLDLYTHIYLEGNKWHVYQEVKGKEIPKSRGTYPKDKSPWIPVRFTKVDGEHYGRGYVEEYQGDIISLEGLTQAIVEGSAAAAKVLIMVDPNGTTDKKAVSNAPNGAVITGKRTDISTMQLEKYADFRVTLDTIQRIEERLSFAFLLNSSVQRKGERVTAEEIRYMASELEAALGGIYSVLSQELQLPLVNRLLFAMERAKKLPVLPKGMVKPVIITGMEALGRGNDLNKLEQFIQPLLQSELLMSRVNIEDYLKRRATSLGMDIKGLIKSEEEIQQEQQQALMQQMGPDMLNQGMGMIQQAMGATQ